MQLKVVQRLVGLLILLFSLIMLPPLLVALIFGDGDLFTFLSSFAITLIIGLAIWYPVREAKRELRLREGFIVVVLLLLVVSPSIKRVDEDLQPVSGG